MFWSRYNRLVKTQRHGWLLYNSLSNSLASIPDEAHDELKQIMEAPSEYDQARHPGLLAQLVQSGFVRFEGSPEDEIDLMRLSRRSLCYDTRRLGLTIAPTLECNFDCAYCFEESRRPVRMSDEVEEELVHFIQKFGHLDSLHVTWFGGEPLIEIGRIRSLTSRVSGLGVPFSAGIVTNGYLLDSDVVSQLQELRIQFVQVTIDGPEEVHNSRRRCISGAGTYSTILDNLDRLTASWDGRLSVRINVDHTNESSFSDTVELLRKRYSKISVHAGIVTPGANPDISCVFDREAEAHFFLAQAEERSQRSTRLYPGKGYASCTASMRNGFVVGPEGEIYKCWHDVGNPAMVVGGVRKGSEWHWPLISKYMVGTDAFEDPECLQCYALPLCNGGCRHVRLRRKYCGEDVDYCVWYKDRIEEMVERHWEQRQVQSDCQRPPESTG